LHRTPEDPSAFTIPAILASLFMVQAWFDLPTPNIPAWSVSAEWFAYLLYPYVRLYTALFANLARALVVVCSLLVLELVGSDHPLLRICPEFALGMMVYDLNNEFSFTQSAGTFAGGFIAGLIATCSYVFVEEHLALYAVLFAALIAVLSNERDWLARFLALPLLIYFGEISYSIYMTHGPVWAFTKNTARILQISFSSPLFLFATILLVLAVSAATFKFVELPARRVLRSSRRPIIENQTASE
jgi:peptidoglycan/LPS O-acetylase OafA/YrhL